MLGIAADRGIDRLQAAGDLLERGGLFVGALRQLAGARIQLVARGRNRGRHLPDLADDLGKAVDHRVDLGGQIAQLVAPLDVGVIVEMPLMKLTGDLDDLEQGAE